MDTAQNVTHQVSKNNNTQPKSRLHQRFRLVFMCQRLQKYYFLIKSHYEKCISFYCLWAFGIRARKKRPNIRLVWI